MAEAVIVEAVRSAVGKRNGGLSVCTRPICRPRCSTVLAERAGIDPEIVDDVIWVRHAGRRAGSTSPAPAVLTAGWPETILGVTVDRQCGSSQQSVHFRRRRRVAGHHDAVVAGGVESMSRTPMGAPLANGGNRTGDPSSERYHRAPNQGIGAR